MTAPRLGFVGTGAVATALAVAWARSGGRVVAVVSRDAARERRLAERCGAPGGSGVDLLGEADVVVVAVPDRAIGDAGALLAGVVRLAGPVVLHTSGALAGEELLRDTGPGRFRVGSLHPLQAFTPGPATSDGEAADVAGIHWFHEGEGEDRAREMVALWRGTFHRLAPGGKALYHAGAAILSNHTVALFADATRLFAAAGVAPEDARPALAALLAGTGANLASVGVPGALTGPVARGDAATVRCHVEALRAAAPDLAEAYCALARRAIVVAREKGSIDADAVEAIERALSGR